MTDENNKYKLERNVHMMHSILSTFHFVYKILIVANLKSLMVKNKRQKIKYKILSLDNLIY